MKHSNAHELHSVYFKAMCNTFQMTSANSLELSNNATATLNQNKTTNQENPKQLTSPGKYPQREKLEQAFQSKAYRIAS